MIGSIVSVSDLNVRILLENPEEILVGDDVLWQTGFIPNWGTTEVAFQTEWHYYSRLK